MSSLTVSASPARHGAPSSAIPHCGRGRRTLLVLATAASLGAALAMAATGAPAQAEPDLVRVLRFMALLKGGLALLAAAGSFLRLARPAAGWRTALYVSGPGLIAAGAVGLWSMQAAGASALVLHAALAGMLAAALTDPDLIAGRRRAR